MFTIRTAALLFLPFASAGAQARTFIARLGADTVAVERVVASGNVVTGEVVRHTPSTTVLRYSLTRNTDGSVSKYEEGIYLADGRPAPATPQGVSQQGMRMTFVGDSVVRELTRNGQPLVLRNAAPGVTIPAIGGTSPFWQEVALNESRRRHASEFNWYGWSAAQDAPNVTGVSFMGRDSAEFLLNQGFRRGFRLDRDGHLLHGDATNTTVRLQITPVYDADLGGIASAWAANEVAGKGMGVPSARDSIAARVGEANVKVAYGRPSRRGREIWGKLVPFDTVWRMGANFPTIITVDHTIQVGSAPIVAGRYSLWLVPGRDGGTLLVNRQVDGWVGVPMHDAAQDLASIPMKREGVRQREERLVIAVEGGRLSVTWDDTRYAVAVTTP